MSAAHTPGTWVVKPWVAKDANGAIDNTGLQVFAVDGTTETGIFSCCDESESDREVADIYLIAAAPDLLAALYAVLHDCGDLDMFESNEPGRDKGAYQMAHEAIAKATGAKE